MARDPVWLILALLQQQLNQQQQHPPLAPMGQLGHSTQYPHLLQNLGQQQATASRVAAAREQALTNSRSPATASQLLNNDSPCSSLSPSPSHSHKQRNLAARLPNNHNHHQDRFSTNDADLNEPDEPNHVGYPSANKRIKVIDNEQQLDDLRPTSQEAAALSCFSSSSASPEHPARKRPGQLAARLHKSASQPEARGRGGEPGHESGAHICADSSSLLGAELELDDERESDEQEDEEEEEGGLGEDGDEDEEEEEDEDEEEADHDSKPENNSNSSSNNHHDIGATLANGSSEAAIAQ